MGGGRRKVVVSSVAVALTLCCASLGAAASFHTDGQFIRDRYGRAVFFHGVNAVWKRPPYYPPSTLFGTRPGVLSG